MRNVLPYPEKVTLDSLFKEHWCKEDYKVATQSNLLAEFYSNTVTKIYDYHHRKDFRLKYWVNTFHFRTGKGLLSSREMKRRKSLEELIAELGEDEAFKMNGDDIRMFERVSINADALKLMSFSIEVKASPSWSISFKSLVFEYQGNELVPIDENFDINWSSVFVPDFMVIKFEQYFEINGRSMPKESHANADLNIEFLIEKLFPNLPVRDTDNKLLILKALKSFIKDKKKLPDKQELWQFVLLHAVSDYTVNANKIIGLANGGNDYTKRNFTDNWNKWIKQKDE